MRFISIDLQVKPTMRKIENFTVYPVLKTDQVFLIQSSRRIGEVNLDDGVIYLSKGRSSGSYGVDLCEARGAKHYTLTDEQVIELTEARDRMSGETNDDRTVTLIG